MWLDKICIWYYQMAWKNLCHISIPVISIKLSSIYIDYWCGFNKFIFNAICEYTSMYIFVTLLSISFIHNFLRRFWFDYYYNWNFLSRSSFKPCFPFVIAGLTSLRDLKRPITKFFSCAFVILIHALSFFHISHFS